MTHNSSDKKNITRTLEIISCIQQGAGLNAVELADRFQVSKRTIYRDLSVIRTSGLPVRFDNLADGYRILPTSESFTIRRQITLEQIREFVLGLYCCPWFQVDGTRTIIEKTLELLIDKLDETQRVSIRRLQRACRFFSNHEAACSLQRDILQAVADSIMRRHRIELLVANHTKDIANLPHDPQQLDEETWIEFAPHAIFYENEMWFISGQSDGGESASCFNIARISNAKLTTNAFSANRSDHNSDTISQSRRGPTNPLTERIRQWKNSPSVAS
ncbi:MAG: HTH domain-containing protein [Planctomycetaceae bacterium]|jgi:predicted DNA-binding transcriptional regulator YafY|nr:HTH domain-containing protein [Planctomycetaceae bacterium]MBT4012254.1 HTH domain-containing protein [Planctomycetaceae bacterium]MBT4724588.1 HTH domain-containing protein [Planctomycetaceae bacterium]MBT4844339.1 HTH domain-containing protein [Planctomycetaceae bacterium]MBT5123621.1 HTH domain-containing protein [Planctomycetaceae bacterium]